MEFTPIDKQLFMELAIEKHQNGLETKYILLSLISHYRQVALYPLKLAFVDILNLDPSVEDVERATLIQERMAEIQANITYLELEVTKMRKLRAFIYLTEEKVMKIITDFIDLIEDLHIESH